MNINDPEIKKAFEKTKKTTFSAVIPTVCLSLIKEHPRHGYDIMKEGNSIYEKHLKEKLGFCEGKLFTPSNTYPVLKEMEEKGLLKAEWKERKKYYYITKKGLKVLELRKKTIKQIMLVRFEILREIFDEKFVKEVIKEASK